MAATRRWQEMSFADFEGLDPERTVAVLPLGAIEQHGPHLPVMVDAAIATAVCERAVDAVAGPARPLLLPTSVYGKSVEHLRYPGTLTLSAATLQAVWTEIGASVARAGVRKLVMVNAHGGQPQVMEIVARELRIRHDMLAVATSWYGAGLPEGLFDARETRFGIHAGDVETSMMLALHPATVNMDAARNFASQGEELAGLFERLTYTGAVNLAWMMQDLNPDGAVGDAAAATAEKGRAVIDHAAAALARLLAEVAACPLSVLRER